MKWIAFGKWDGSHGDLFNRVRIYKDGYKWTPFVKVTFRYGIIATSLFIFKWLLFALAVSLPAAIAIAWILMQ